jgi:branched-chain amino acid transport system substrate-binding protein
MAASGCLLAALAVGACGSDDSSGGGGGGGSSSGDGGGKTLNVYSSLPAQGAQRTQTTAVINGIKLALDQAGNKAGNFTIKYTPLDDSTAQAGAWTPEQTQANARKAAQDDNIGGYIGEFNSGASAISIPILNEAGVPQVSPANTAVGLTSNAAGASPGEPDKYYPSGQRTYTRIVPKDTIQGAALATLMKQDGCTKVEMTNDKEVYGAGLAKNIQLAAKGIGLTIIANDAIDKNAPNYRSLAAKAMAAGADCFVYSGITAASSCSRTSRRRCHRRSSTARTASPSPASTTPRTAASRPRSASASR